MTALCDPFVAEKYPMYREGWNDYRSDKDAKIEKTLIHDIAHQERIGKLLSWFELGYRDAWWMDNPQWRDNYHALTRHC